MKNLSNNCNVKETDRHFKKRLPVSVLSTVIVLIVFACLILLFGFPSGKIVNSYKSGFALDTVVSINIYEGGDNDIAEKMFKLCREYEQKYFSPSINGSELYKINNLCWDSYELLPGNKKVIELSKPMYDVFDIAYYYRQTDEKYSVAVKPITDLWDFHDVSKSVVPSNENIEKALNDVGKIGIDFDIAYGYEFTDNEGNEQEYEYALILWNPSTFDLGSVAKGYIADCLKEYAINNGVTSAIIDLGGSISCIGSRPSKGLIKRKFNIQIDTAFLNNSDTQQTVRVSDKSVVTSGKYQRCFDKDGKHYHHILDSTTGYPVETELASVTVIGKSAGKCDALSTACFIVGEEKSLEILTDTGYGAIFIYDDGTVHRHLKK